MGSDDYVWTGKMVRTIRRVTNLLDLESNFDHPAGTTARVTGAGPYEHVTVRFTGDPRDHLVAKQDLELQP